MQIMETSEFSPFSPVLPFKFNTRQFLHKTMKLEIIWFVLLDFLSSSFIETIHIP